MDGDRLETANTWHGLVLSCWFKTQGSVCVDRTAVLGHCQGVRCEWGWITYSDEGVCSGAALHSFLDKGTAFRGCWWQDELASFKEESLAMWNQNIKNNHSTFFLIDFGERGRGGHRSVTPLICAFIGWFSYVPWLGIEPHCWHIRTML